MMHRAIAAAVLVVTVLASGASAAFQSATYTEADALAAGRRTSGAVYDGTPASLAVQGDVNGALTRGNLVTPAVASVPPGTLLAPRAVPALTPEPKDSSFFSRQSLMFGAAGAGIGAVAGWFLGGSLGGPIGALIGAAAGFAIGFMVSKLLG